MTQIAVPDDVMRLISTELAAGAYDSQADVLREALLSLAERREALVGIRDGLADVEAGRVREFIG